MDVLTLLDRLDTYLQECSHLPLVGKILVDEDEVFDLIDALQAAIPREFEHANWVIRAEEQIKAEARKEAQRMLEDAQGQIAIQASEHAIVKEARAQAEELVSQAQAVAGEILMGAREYADSLMQEVEDILAVMLEKVEQDRSELGVQQPGNPELGETEAVLGGLEEEEDILQGVDDELTWDEAHDSGAVHTRRALWDRDRD